MFLFLSPLFAYLFSEEEYLESLSSPPTRKGSLLLFIECLERLWDVVGENVSWCLWLFALVGLFSSFAKFREFFRQKKLCERVGRPNWNQKPVTASTASDTNSTPCPQTRASVPTAHSDVCNEQDAGRIYSSVMDFHTRLQQPHEDYDTYAAALLSAIASS